MQNYLPLPTFVTPDVVVRDDDPLEDPVPACVEEEDPKDEPVTAPMRAPVFDPDA